MAASCSSNQVQRRRRAGLWGWGSSCWPLRTPACLVLFPLVRQSRGAGPKGHPGSQRHQWRRGPPRPARPRGLPRSTRPAWHHREARSPGTSFPLLRVVFAGLGHFSETDVGRGAASKGAGCPQSAAALTG